MSDLSKNLRKLREERNLNQVDISEYLKMSRPGYFKYEKGTAQPNVKNLIKLADLYNISIDELVGRKGKEENIHLREIQKQKEIKQQIKDISENIIKDFLNEKEEEIIKRINSVIK